MDIKNKILVLALLVMAVLPMVFAAEGDAEAAKAEISEYVNTTLVVGVRFVAGIAALGAVIFSAIQLITAQGDPEKIKKGFFGIGTAVIGLVILFFAPQLVAIFTPG